MTFRLAAWRATRAGDLSGTIKEERGSVVAWLNASAARRVLAGADPDIATYRERSIEELVLARLAPMPCDLRLTANRSE
jgi:hypothetical protein